MPSIVHERYDSASGTLLLTLHADCAGIEAVTDLRQRLDAAVRDERRRVVLCCAGRELGAGALIAILGARPFFDVLVLCELPAATEARLHQADPKGVLTVCPDREDALRTAGREGSGRLAGLAAAVRSLQASPLENTARPPAPRLPEAGALRAVRDLLRGAS